MGIWRREVSRVGASYRVMSKAPETHPLPCPARLRTRASVSLHTSLFRSFGSVGWFLISSDWGGFGAMHPTP
ncbi:hypothetical protein CGRA01v4_14442 [Colletotrichum graminicola]|nr:hypothetical protein CGRA01v4_14442 [Colletotrichum graminicola]